MDIDKVLFQENADKYGSDYQKAYLEIYKLYVEMADRISLRRHNANSFFLTINSAIIAVLGYVQFGVYLGAKLGVDQTQTNDFYWIISVLGMVLCFAWYRLIKSYQQLNTAKFKVIHHIEQRLPIAPYNAEWEAVGRGEHSELYKPFTHIETKIPWIFFILNLAVFVKVSLSYF
ncbi:small integral membrane protein [Beggiatoa sp. PS]|nr:small integral membrane protein [Beggiatoa sp. PS]